MSYVQKILQPNETILVVGKMHWIVYTRGFTFIIAGVLVILLLGSHHTYGTIAGIGGAVLCAFGVIMAISAWFEKWTTEIAVTDKRVIHKKGFISRSTREMNMDKVESVTVDQTLLGRLLNYGSIVVRGTGAGLEGLHHIADPLALRSAIVVR